MSQHDDVISLQQMLEHARRVLTICDGKSRSDLQSDGVLALTVVRLLEVIGEAANRVSKPVQTARPEIPWADVIGTRNRLITRTTKSISTCYGTRSPTIFRL
jgi:uncharacterized protein with HEPN domain